MPPRLVFQNGIILGEEYNEGMEKFIFPVALTFLFPEFAYACGGSNASFVYELLVLAGIFALFSCVAFFGLKSPQSNNGDLESYLRYHHKVLLLEFFSFLIGWTASSLFVHPATLCFVMPNDAFAASVISYAALFLICFTPIHLLWTLVCRLERVTLPIRIRLARSLLYLLAVGYAVTAVFVSYLALVVQPKISNVLPVPADAYIALPQGAQIPLHQ